MKTPPNKYAPKGFTLVELLVVIVIIAMLASIGFSVGLGALQRAKRTTALAAATNVANAVEQFYSEYNLLPDPTGNSTDDNTATPFVTTASDGTKLLEILAGLEDDQNERKIRFLGVTESDNGKKGGIVFNSTGTNVVGLYDPWGQPFYVILDYNYDGRLAFSPSTAYTYNAKLNNKRVAVYSLGTDSPSGAIRKNLVKTW